MTAGERSFFKSFHSLSAIFTTSRACMGSTYGTEEIMIQVAILGYGTVGSGVYEVLKDKP